MSVLKSQKKKEANLFLEPTMTERIIVGAANREKGQS